MELDRNDEFRAPCRFFTQPIDLDGGRSYLRPVAAFLGPVVPSKLRTDRLSRDTHFVMTGPISGSVLSGRVLRRTILRSTLVAGTLAAMLSTSVLLPVSALAQDAPSRKHAGQTHAKKPAPAQAAAPAAQAPKLPARIPFTAADDAAATIPGMPDVRFFADSIADFNQALPPRPGPWLVLSTGGSDGAFGAGFLNGLSAAGNRPDYSVVTGVSSGALMAPFVFAGSRYDGALSDAYTKTTAADIFEVGGTGESFLDTWPLKDLIAKQITPQLLADIANAHQAGRRLFVVTTDLDAQRSVVWNMGAIAVHAQKDGGDAALKLFRQVLLASGAIPGAFPPVLIDVEANGKKFQEMHVDGGVGGQFFVAPPAALESNSGYKIPATQLYIVVNSSLTPDFAVVERSTPLILAQTVGAAVKVDLRLMLDRAFVAAQNSDTGFNVATIPADFNAPSRGAFDPKYMKALYDVGYDQGKGANAFAPVPPPFPGAPAVSPADATPNASPKLSPMPTPEPNPNQSLERKPNDTDKSLPN
jgi:predicted acylesterase/phospholipase RssA